MINTQKSPPLLVALALAAGILLSSILPSPGIWGLGIASLGTAALLIFGRKKIVPRFQVVLQSSLYGCFLIAGWVLGESSAVIPLQDPSRYIGEEMEVTGVISDDVRSTSFGYKTILDITSPMQGKAVLYLPTSGVAPHTNDIVKATVKLQAHPTKNAGYAAWLHHQGIHATVKASSVSKIGEATGFFASLKNLRTAIAQKFSSVFPDLATAGLSNAMLLGDRTALDSEIRADFSATGLSHIVAISGMNFAIIYGVLNLLLTPMLYLRRGRQMRSLIVVPLLAFFALLTGGNPAVVRAAIMLGMLDLSQAFWSKNNSLNALATSALLFLAFDPQSLFTPDFQLSYAAVLGILLLQNPISHYFHLRLPKLPKTLASALAVTLAAQIATTPLVAFHFHTFPSYFLIANMLVLPLVTLVVQIGFAGFLLAWIPGIAEAWAGVMDFLLWAITSLANILADLPGATITSLNLAETGIWILIAQVVAGFLLLERRFLKKSAQHIWSGTRTTATGIAIAGLQRRLAVVSLAVAWVLAAFLLA